MCPIFWSRNDRYEKGPSPGSGIKKNEMKQTEAKRITWSMDEVAGGWWWRGSSTAYFISIVLKLEIKFTLVTFSFLIRWKKKLVVKQRSSWPPNMFFASAFFFIHHNIFSFEQPNFKQWIGIFDRFFSLIPCLFRPVRSQCLASTTNLMTSENTHFIF